MSNLGLTSIIRTEVYKTLVLVLCGALPMLACTRSNGNNYFPLADGSKWKYAGRATSDNNTHLTFHATAKVDGQTLINGHRYFKHVTTSDLSGAPANNRPESVRYYRVADDGIYFRLGSDPNRPELLEMPLPISVGTKWLSGPTEVQAEHAGIVTIAGREYRDCLKITYRQQGVARRLENYLAPNIGVIKAVDVSEAEPGSTTELTLEKYEP